MPCGLFVFDCYPILLLLLLLVILLEPVQSRSLVLPSSSSAERLTAKDRRHSIFDDKNGASLGELVSPTEGFEAIGDDRLFSAYLSQSLWLFTSIGFGNASNENGRRISFGHSTFANLRIDSCHRRFSSLGRSDRRSSSSF